MFIISAKLPRRSLLLSTAAAFLLCCAVLSAVFSLPAVRQVSTSALSDGRGIKTNEHRLEYLQSYGWQLAPEPISTQELLIPKEMDENYSDYLALQESQGFDLKKYAGKRVKRYTYQITNYPTGEQDVVINLLIRKNTVVGGEVLSHRPDGFLHGLNMP